MAIGVFQSPELWAQTYQVRDERGQMAVDQSFMDAQVRACVQSSTELADISECVGAFSGDCMNENLELGQSTLGMFFCVEAETAVWTALVEESTEILLQHYSVLDEGDAGSAESLPLRVPSLMEAQSRWAESRDADCLVEYLQWRGGSGAKLIGAGCRLEKTSKRMFWLRSLSEEN